MNIRIVYRVKPVLVILGWSTSMAAFALTTIFQGQLLPREFNGGGNYVQVLNASPLGLWIFYFGTFATSVLAAMVISDAGKALVSFFVSFLGAAIITDLVLSLPDFLGIFAIPGALQEAAVIFTFTAFFPLLLLVTLAGTILGIGLGERLLSD